MSFCAGHVVEAYLTGSRRLFDQIVSLLYMHYKFDAELLRSVWPRVWVSYSSS